LEELRKAKPNGGVTYIRTNEVSKRPLVFYEPLVAPMSPSKSKPMLFREVAQRKMSEVVVVAALV